MGGEGRRYEPSRFCTLPPPLSEIRTESGGGFIPLPRVTGAVMRSAARIAGKNMGNEGGREQVRTTDAAAEHRGGEC